MEFPGTLIDLIRHGEPVGGSRYRGHTDDPLSDKGWQQMRAAVGDQNPWDRIISSPLLRCAEFARELATRHTIPMQTDDRFKEIYFGPWEGKTADQLLAMDKDCLQRFWSDPVNNMPAGAETIAEFEQRVLTGWEEISSQYSGQHLLLVGHGGMMRVILSHVLGMPRAHMFRLSVKYAAISRIRLDDYGDRIMPIVKFHAGQL
jgi:alpha-ribazole phosphatase/probable phosphoglycerate mutase